MFCSISTVIGLKMDADITRITMGESPIYNHIYTCMYTLIGKIVGGLIWQCRKYMFPNDDVLSPPNFLWNLHQLLLSFTWASSSKTDRTGKVRLYSSIAAVVTADKFKRPTD